MIWTIRSRSVFLMRVKVAVMAVLAVFSLTAIFWLVIGFCLAAFALMFIAAPFAAMYSAWLSHGTWSRDIDAQTGRRSR